MATFFGRPVGTLYKDVGLAATEGAVLGALIGYRRAVDRGDEHPFLSALRTAGEWAATDIVTETALGVFAPGVRGGTPLRSALVSTMIGGASGMIEGYAAASVHGRENPLKQAFITGGQWAAIDGSIDFMTRSGFPLLQSLFNK
jgi:hypothetical protein